MQGRREGGAAARQPLMVAALVLVGGLLLTLLAWRWLDQREQQDAQLHFERLADRVERELQRRLELPVYGLHGARGLYAASREVRRDEFRNYVDSRQLAQEFPGIRGFGFVERVMRGDVERFLAATRADGAPDFVIASQGRAEDLMVVKYLEPLAANRAALGLDLGGEPVRREAVERAVRSGQATLSGRITLRQDAAQSPGFLLLVPIYRPGSDPSTEAQRWRALVGLVYAPIVASEVLAGLDRVTDGMLALQLYAGSEAAPQHFMFGSQGAAQSPRSPSLFTEERRLTVGGSTLLLRASTLPAFENSELDSSARWLALGGALLSLALALAAWLLASGRTRAEQLARAMTADLERLALVARVTTNAVIATDAQQRISWVNEGFSRITGYSAAEALGRTPGELLGSGQASPQALRTLAEAVAAGTACRVEILNRRKDGGLFWVDTELQPVHDGQGRLTGFVEIALDISDSKRAAEQLWQERERLANIIDGTGAGTWEWNVQSGAVHYNERWAGMLGYTLAELAPLGYHTWTALAHPEDLAASELLLQSHLRGDIGRYEAELRVRHKDGHWVWVQSRAKLLAYTPSGEPLSVAGTHLDITVRKTMEQAQQRSSELMRVMLENLPCGLTMFDAQLGLMLHNSRYAQLYGLDAAFLADAPVTVEKIARRLQGRGEYGEIGVEQALQAAGERARAALQAPHYWERSRPDGLVLEMRSAPLASGGFVTTYTDVSEQRRAAAKLAQTLAMLTAVLDAASKVAIIATDRQRLISVFNRGAEQLLGYAAAELVGRRGTADLHQTEDLQAYGEAVSAQLGQPLSGHAAMIHPSQLGREVECHYVRKDGSQFPAVRVVTEMRDADGGFYGYLGVAYDITRQKEQEASLREAKALAEQASAAKSQFLAHMSHEIRTPMNAILGMLRLLQKTSLDLRQRDYAGKAEGAARSLLGLLNDILDFSKIEAGKLGLDPQPFSPARLLRDSEAILQAYLDGRPLSLRCELDPRLPDWLLGDAMRLQQVLINLGSNAIKFTSEGGVRLSLRELGREADRVRLELRVSDTGIGIAPEHQTKIFAGFTQAEDSITRRFGGTGLGLAISQHLLQLMGGQLRLQSQPGEGSEFFCELSLALATAPPELPAPTAAPGLEGRVLSPQRLAGLRLLVVEDNLNNQQIAKELLQDEGAEVLLAGDGRQALDLLAAGERFDALLMDVQMPVMDGLSATRHIRAQAAHATLPIIALTADASAADEHTCRAAGMNAHIGKPFEIDALVRLLWRCTGRAATASAAVIALPELPAELARRAAAAGLDLPGALRRLMGKRGLYARMLESFAAKAAALPAQLDAQLAQGGAGSAEHLHGFRGLALTLGADRLAALARRGEERLRHGGTPDPAWRAELVQAVDDSVPLLRQLSEALAGPAAMAVTAAPLDRAQARAELDALALLLRQSDLAALAALERLRRQHGAALRLEALDEAIAALDFERALQYCQALIGDLAS